MAEDIDIWNFELSIEDMEIIKKLNIGHSGITDHLNIDIVEFLNQHKIHD